MFSLVPALPGDQGTRWLCTKACDIPAVTPPVAPGPSERGLLCSERAAAEGTLGTVGSAGVSRARAHPGSGRGGRGRDTQPLEMALCVRQPRGHAGRGPPPPQANPYCCVTSVTSQHLRTPGSPHSPSQLPCPRGLPRIVPGSTTFQGSPLPSEAARVLGLLPLAAPTPSSRHRLPRPLSLLASSCAPHKAQLSHRSLQCLCFRGPDHGLPSSALLPALPAAPKTPRGRAPGAGRGPWRVSSPRLPTRVPEGADGVSPTLPRPQLSPPSPTAPQWTGALPAWNPPRGSRPPPARAAGDPRWQGRLRRGLPGAQRGRGADAASERRGRVRAAQCGLNLSANVCADANIVF